MPAFYNDTTPAAPAGSQNVKWQVDGSGNVSAYLPTAPLAAPSLNLLAQSAAISTTTFFATGTTPGAGMYRLSYYTYVTVAGNAVNLTATFTWQDDSGAAANTLTTGNIACNTLGANSETAPGLGEIIFYSEASVNISYATALSGAIGTGRYALRLRLEYLG